jgi:FdhE protein
VTSAAAASRKLEEIARDDPELAPYAAVLGAALAAAAEDWPLDLTGAEGRLLAGEPALHGAVLTLPRERVEALYRQLTQTPLSLRAERGIRGLPVATDASLDARHDKLAAALADGLALRSADTIHQLTLMPVLQAAARMCEPAVAEAMWSSGICPVCAAWPALAESRGLDRLRVLRCGRCGSGWHLPWQLCPFCANSDHASLSYLMSDQIGESRRVFACDRCQGYLKTLATLAPIEPLAVPVEDLATLELDLAALDAGRQRPSEPGFRLEAELRLA